MIERLDLDISDYIHSYPILMKFAVNEFIYILTHIKKNMEKISQNNNNKKGIYKCFLETFASPLNSMRDTFLLYVESVNVIVAFMNIVILITVVETKDKSVSLHGTYI